MHQVMQSNLDRPDARSFTDFHRLLRDEAPLIGPDATAWDDKADLILFRRSEGRDLFSKWVSRKLVPLFHEVIGNRFKVSRLPFLPFSGIWLNCLICKKPITEAPSSRFCNYTERDLTIMVDIVGTVISSLLPISSILVLYFVTSVLTRLGIVAGFTVCFSLVLSLVTEARRVEIFAATAAFASPRPLGYRSYVDVEIDLQQCRWYL